MSQARLQLMKFDPFQMPSDLVRRLAVGRDATMREMMVSVDENLAADVGPPQHYCLVAPRGTGKTFVLRLLGLALDERAVAGEKLLFLHLPEEMPHVLSPISFLREIRRRLRGEGPAANASRKHDDMAEWNGLAADIDAELAARFGAGEGLLVLCVENIKDVLRDAFPAPGHQRNLRAWLERPAGRVMMIAASSAGPFDKDSEEALFAIVKNIDLKPWTVDETMAFLEKVMWAREGRGMRAEDERVARAITSFTGGSPRMAVALAEVMGAEDALSAAQTLAALIDNLQEYYLDRLKDMGREAKRCIANMLVEGENVSQTQVARRLGLAQSDVAQIFRKLETDSVIIGDRLAEHKEKLYRVADRVFVHFYNVRVLYHGAERSVLAPILDFLVSAFSENERVDQAKRMMARGLHRDAAVLLDTLPDNSRVAFEKKWFISVADFLDRVADMIEARAANPEAVRFVRRMASEGGTAEARAADESQPHLEGGLPGLSAFVAGLGHLAGGRSHRARQWLRQASAESVDGWLVCLIAQTQAVCEYVAGDLAAEDGFARQAEAEARQVGQSDLLAMSLAHTFYVESMLGNWAEAERVAREITELSYPEGLGWWRAVGLRRLARVYDEKGDRQKAEQCIRRALEVALAASNPLQVAFCKLALAERIDPSAAEERLELADRAGEVCLQERDFKQYLMAAALACDALRALGKPLVAVERSRMAVFAVEHIGSLYLRAHAYCQLAWELSSPALKGDQIAQSEALDYARRALALLEDSPAFSWERSVALEANLAVAVAAGNASQRVEEAERLIPVVRQAGRPEALAWAQAELIHGLIGRGQFDVCIVKAVSALEELLNDAALETENIGFIARQLVQALREKKRENEMKAIFDGMRSKANSRPGSRQRGLLARAFIGPAFESGDYAWGAELAEDLMRDRTEIAAAGGLEWPAALACIAGARCWDQMDPYLDDAFWRKAAAMGVGYALSLVLQRTEASQGRAASYAVFHGFWNVLHPMSSPDDAKFEAMMSLLTSYGMRDLTGGLLEDIAGTLAAEGGGRFDAEEKMLRAFAMFEESGRDPAMLAQINPDVATALRLADPSLSDPVMATTVKKRKPVKSKSKTDARRRG